MDGRVPMILVMVLMLAYVVWRGVSDPDSSLSSNTNDPKHGQELFEKKCASCHEPKAGIPLKAPVLGFYGQEYRMTDRELVETAKQGGHKQDEEAVAELSDEDRQAFITMKETMKKTTAALSAQDVRDIVVFLKTSWTSDAQLEHWMITHQPKDQ